MVTRAKWTPRNTSRAGRIREVLKCLTQEQLMDSPQVFEAVKKAGIRKISKTTVYSIRKQILGHGTKNGATHDVSLSQALKVKELAKDLGGMEVLKTVIKALEKSNL